jgi:phage shock protein A
MKRKESLAKEMTSKTKDLENQISAIEKEVGAVRTQLDGRKEAIEELARESRDAEEEKAKLDDERR